MLDSIINRLEQLSRDIMGLAIDVASEATSHTNKDTIRELYASAERLVHSSQLVDNDTESFKYLQEHDRFPDPDDDEPNIKELFKHLN